MNLIQMLNDSIKNRSVLRLLYAHDEGILNAHIVRPSRLDSYLTAFDIVTNLEKSFDLERIRSCEVFTTILEAWSYEQRLVFRLQEEMGAVQVDPTLANSSLSHKIPNRTPIQKITNGARWNQALHYFSECLIREHLKNLDIIFNDLVPFRCSLSSLGPFFNGKLCLSLNRRSDAAPMPISRWIAEVSALPEASVVLGFPFWIDQNQHLVPLFITRVQIQTEPGLFLLRARQIEVSQRFLDCIGLSEEGKRSILQFANSILQKRLESDFESALSEILIQLRILSKEKLPVVLEENQPGTLFYIPALFSDLCSSPTENLAIDLQSMRNPGYWSVAPAAIKKILMRQLTSMEETQPAANADPGLFFAPLSAALRAMIASHSLSDIDIFEPTSRVETSNIVLNLIGREAYSGHRVWVCAKDSALLEDWMDRLSSDWGFKGILWSGVSGRADRLISHAGSVIQNLIDSEYSLNREQNLIDEYQDVTRELYAVEAMIAPIRDVEKQLATMRQARESMFEKLSDEWRSFLIVSPMNISPDHLLAFTKQLEEWVKLINELEGRSSTTILRVVEDINDFLDYAPDFQGLAKKISLACGFSKGRLTAFGLSRINDWRIYLITWLSVIEAIKVENTLQDDRIEFSKARERTTIEKPNLPKSLGSKVNRLVEQFSREMILAKKNIFQQLGKDFLGVADQQPGISEKLLHGLGFDPAMEPFINLFNKEMFELGLVWPPKNRVEVPAPREYAYASGQIVRFLDVVAADQAIAKLGPEIEDLESRFGEILQGLPRSVQPEMKKSQGFRFAAVDFENKVRESAEELSKQEAELDPLIDAVRQQVHPNNPVIEPFFEDERINPSILNLPEELLNLSTLKFFLSQWQLLLECWLKDQWILEADERLRQYKIDFDKHSDLDSLENRSVHLATQILQNRWWVEVNSLPSETMIEVEHYIRSNFQKAESLPPKSKVEEFNEAISFKNMVKVFPVLFSCWPFFISDIPLKPGLFDLIILVDSSNWEIPEAIALLYRAKRAVLIRTQPSIIPSNLCEEADRNLAIRFNIDPEVFQYHSRSVGSLFDRT